MQEDLDLMIEILSHCRNCAVERNPAAWDWYSVFCEAWNRLGKDRLKDVPGYSALRYALSCTQATLQEMKQEMKPQ